MHLRAIHGMFSKLLDCNFSLIIFLNSILAYDQAHAVNSFGITAESVSVYSISLI